MITDITGRVVHTEYLGCFIQGKHKIIINRNRLSSGIYFLTTISDFGKQTQKIVTKL
ncbi:MAG: T9SS type A sorting domain-containing protein [Bacteroidales bacterium]|nr:T9SS type A sorting domain-containing protein [Bacteroidales bacterium]